MLRKHVSDDFAKTCSGRQHHARQEGNTNDTLGDGFRQLGGDGAATGMSHEKQRTFDLLKHFFQFGNILVGG